jgi:hypothetical protein
MSRVIPKPPPKGTWPQNKYFFKKLLKEEGDIVEYGPASEKELQALRKAAWEWAWRNRVTIRTWKVHLEGGLGVRVKLLKKYRINKKIPLLLETL